MKMVNIKGIRFQKYGSLPRFYLSKIHISADIKRAFAQKKKKFKRFCNYYFFIHMGLYCVNKKLGGFKIMSEK